MSVGLQSVPRAPKSLPLLGHAWQLWREPFGFLKSLKNTGDVVRVDLGTMPVYFVTTTDLTHQLLVRKARSFDKGRFFEKLRDLVGNGLAASDGEVHLRQRRLMQPMFHQARIAGYVDTMAERAREMAESWEPGQTVAVDKAMGEYVIGTLAETMLTSDISQSTKETFARDVSVLLKSLLVRTVTPAFLDRLPLAANREFHAASARIRQVIDEVIAATHESDLAERTDLLSMLVAARDADTGEALSDKEVRDQLVTILAAGTDTTASTLSWTFHELARQPDVEQRVLDEIDTIVGNRPVEVHDVAKLEYTGRVLKEVMRLHAVPLLMRRATEPVEIGGVELPTGTEVAFSLYALHQDPDLYPEPERFDPDRFLPEPRRELPRNSFMPFGSGNRMCIGEAFAWTHLVVAVATILSHRRLRPLPGHLVKEAIAAVAHPDRLPMTVIARGT